jgi:hypothetical protein
VGVAAGGFYQTRPEPAPLPSIVKGFLEKKLTLNDGHLKKTTYCH